MKKYILDKVLYIAAKPAGFNLDRREFRLGRTDAAMIVHKCLANGRLVEVEGTEECHYFNTTLKGEIKLAELQLCYRRRNNQEEADVLHRLEVLKSAASLHKGIDT
jgi:hypothetical protein